MVYCPWFVDPPARHQMLPLTIVHLQIPLRNNVSDFCAPSSPLRITTKYEMPAIQLEVVRDAYPETPEGLDPSKPLGGRIFSGRTPHQNKASVCGLGDGRSHLDKNGNMHVKIVPDLDTIRSGEGSDQGMVSP